MLYSLFKIKFIVHIHNIFNILSVAESTEPDSVHQEPTDTTQNTPADDVRYFYQHVFSIIFMKDIKLLVIYHNFVLWYPKGTYLIRTIPISIRCMQSIYNFKCSFLCNNNTFM